HENVRSPDNRSTPQDRTVPGGTSGGHHIDGILRGVIDGGGGKRRARYRVGVRQGGTNVQIAGSDGENIVLADIGCSRNGIDCSAGAGERFIGGLHQPRFHLVRRKLTVGLYQERSRTAYHRRGHAGSAQRVIVTRIGPGVRSRLVITVSHQILGILLG